MNPSLQRAAAAGCNDLYEALLRGLLNAADFGDPLEPMSQLVRRAERFAELAVWK